MQLWNRQAEELWGLRADEVAGKHLLNLDIGLPVDQLKDPVRACLSDGAAAAPVELSAVNRRGRPIDAARVLPAASDLQGRGGRDRAARRDPLRTGLMPYPGSEGA